MIEIFVTISLTENWIFIIDYFEVIIQFVELSENYQKLLLKYWIFSKSRFQKYEKCSNFKNFRRIYLVNELVLTFWALVEFSIQVFFRQYVNQNDVNHIAYVM